MSRSTVSWPWCIVEFTAAKEKPFETVGSKISFGTYYIISIAENVQYWLIRDVLIEIYVSIKKKSDDGRCSFAVRKFKIKVQR